MGSFQGFEEYKIMSKSSVLLHIWFAVLKYSFLVSVWEKAYLYATVIKPLIRKIMNCQSQTEKRLRGEKYQKEFES